MTSNAQNGAEPVRVADRALYAPSKMGKTTLFESPRVLVGLNAFEPGQEHAPHAHEGADKIYYVIEGEGEFSLNDTKMRLRTGDMLAAPAGVPHGVKNDGGQRLLVMAVIAPGPAAKSS